MSDLPSRQVHGIILMLDTNCINARGSDLALNQIEKWRQDEVVVVIMDKVSHREALKGGSDARSRKAMSHVFSLDVGRAAEDEQRSKTIEAIVFPPGCKSQNERNDVELVSQARRFNAHLITRDGGSSRQPGGLLGNRDQLQKAVGVRIVTPEEAVDLVQGKIKTRDELTRYRASRVGAPLPEWVGRD